jgi:MoaC family
MAKPRQTLPSPAYVSLTHSLTHSLTLFVCVSVSRCLYLGLSAWVSCLSACSLCRPLDGAPDSGESSSSPSQHTNEPLTKKGPLYSTAIIAGVMGAKQTSSLIPFCHPLPLQDCQVDIRMLSKEEYHQHQLQYQLQEKHHTRQEVRGRFACCCCCCCCDGCSLCEGGLG